MDYILIIFASFVFFPMICAYSMMFYYKLVSDFSPDKKKRKESVAKIIDVREAAQIYYEWLFSFVWKLLKYSAIIIIPLLIYIIFFYK
jgi:hypothetical protein